MHPEFGTKIFCDLRCQKKKGGRGRCYCRFLDLFMEKNEIIVVIEFYLLMKGIGKQSGVSLKKVTLKKVTFGNMIGKEENADYQHFLFSPKCFLLFHRKTSLCHVGFVVNRWLEFRHVHFFIS